MIQKNSAAAAAAASLLSRRREEVSIESSSSSSSLRTGPSSLPVHASPDSQANSVLVRTYLCSKVIRYAQLVLELLLLKEREIVSDGF